MPFKSEINAVKSVFYTTAREQLRIRACAKLEHWSYSAFCRDAVMKEVQRLEGLNAISECMIDELGVKRSREDFNFGTPWDDEDKKEKP